jgi:hypothetical protein
MGEKTMTAVVPVTVSHLTYLFENYGGPTPIDGDSLALLRKQQRTEGSAWQVAALRPERYVWVAGARFPRNDQTYTAAHYVLDGEYVHGRCLDTFLDQQAGYMGTDGEKLDRGAIWELLVNEGCWTPESRSMIDENEHPDPTEGLEACLVCRKPIFLPQ